MKKVLCFFVVMCCYCIDNQAQNSLLKLNKSNYAQIITDGVLDENEWFDAKAITIEGLTETLVTVYLKYDTENLYVAFKNLTNSENSNHNAEVLISSNLEAHNWGEQCYWFHSSYSNCSAVGQYYYWEDCSALPMGWIANNFPFKEGNDNIEFRISFSKLGLNPSAGIQIKMAFKISNPLEQHGYWPEVANIANPDTWGTITFN
ncbi:DOMON domain-containing protein [Aestuariivivens marinum]|uniref:hypothetical protein n=1 Tax=Aestuariivivens marinum TaxID=2913555 RepID=UPI001F57CCCD|nr:hypothetical protein [Aestuariivivens marinum]